MVVIWLKNKTARLRQVLAATSAMALFVCFFLCAVGCASETVGTSSTDKYEVFQNDETSTFVPQPTSLASTQIGESLILKDEGWWAKDSYIHYGIKVTNPNTSLIARDVPVEIISYDESGKELSHDADIISFIGPDTTIGFAGECGNGQAPTRVEISLGEVGVWQDADGYVEPLLVASITEQDKGYYRYEFTGGVTNNTSNYVSTAPLSILLEDKEGNILAGYTGSTKRIKAGRTHDYQVTINTAPDHAKVEVFVQWSSLNDEANASIESQEEGSVSGEATSAESAENSEGAQSAESAESVQNAEGAEGGVSVESMGSAAVLQACTSGDLITSFASKES